MLREYRERRRFDKTPEPPPLISEGAGPFLFVVQKHFARRLHYDLRLEVGGVLKSWAVPGGPSVDPTVKRLAVMVEDHPLEYRNFEGVIPEGQYGAGQVIVWDEGTYIPEQADRTPLVERTRAERAMLSGLESGKLSFTLRGHRLRGSWTLVKMRASDKNWLLIKHKDQYAEQGRDILVEESSVLSGVSIRDLQAGRLPVDDPPRSLDPGRIEGARKAKFPLAAQPMLAYLSASPPPGPGWLFEPKLDGYRTLALVQDGRAKLLSRRGLETTASYPGLAAELNKQPGEMILDGEIIALDEKGRPSFQDLQQYLKSRKTRGGNVTPIVYYVFDVIYLNGHELYDVPLMQRKELLAHAIIESETVRRVVYFDKDGSEVYRASVSQGFEGIMAKRTNSLYKPGQRSHEWIKVKAMLSDDFVIGGYSQGLGSRLRHFGSLLLGYYGDEGRLVYAGHVGSGFSDSALNELTRRLAAIKAKKCPFDPSSPVDAPATWVRPELVAEVKFTEWTQDGRLRTPVFLRLREDKAAEDVRRGDMIRLEAPTSSSKLAPNSAVVDGLLAQLANPLDDFKVDVEGNSISLTHVDKEYWPARGGKPAITKRQLLLYLANVSTSILPHLKDRPLTLKRYPEGINGQHFYQRHWDDHRPDFVEAVALQVEVEGAREFLLCNNLSTLVWLGQIGSIEFHAWFSRVGLHPEGRAGEPGRKGAKDVTAYPDFIVFDLDPYIYSGKEAQGDEPELNRDAFAAVSKVALWLKETLDSLGLSSFVKTSGRTGLHVYTPIERQLDYKAVRSAARTIANSMLQAHPREVSVDWAVQKRTGKVFIDYNQNVRGKTLGAVYAPRVSPEATVSTPLRWDEVGKVYPTEFTILTLPARLSKLGDLWTSILDSKSNLKMLLEVR